MSSQGNTAPPIGTHMLTQLLLSIGLPFLVIPLIATVGYFGFRYMRNRNSAKGDVEKCVKDSGSSSSSSGSGGEDGQAFEMTPALATNSVQVMRAV